MLCLSLLGGGDLPQHAEGMKTCASGGRLSASPRKVGAGSAHCPPLSARLERDSQPLSTSPCSPYHPYRAANRTESNTTPGSTPATLSVLGNVRRTPLPPSLSPTSSISSTHPLSREPLPTYTCATWSSSLPRKLWQRWFPKTEAFSAVAATFGGDV